MIPTGIKAVLVNQGVEAAIVLLSHLLDALAGEMHGYVSDRAAEKLMEKKEAEEEKHNG